MLPLNPSCAKLKCGRRYKVAPQPSAQQNHLDLPQAYLMNQTLSGPLVRALRARAGILLLINQRILHRGSERLWSQLWW